MVRSQRRYVVSTGEAIARHLCPFGLVGIVPDAMLAAVLLFARAGHWMQQVGVMFHAFTALTMAQRSGYAFPATMMAAGELFRPVDGEKADDDTNVTSETTVDPLSSSHASWMQRNWKRYPLVTLWLLVQWLMPARMPIVSNGRYKYTGEGYRFSWTMMMHGQSSFSQKNGLQLSDNANIPRQAVVEPRPCLSRCTHIFGHQELSHTSIYRSQRVGGP